MGIRLSTRQVTWTLVLLWLAAVAVSLSMLGTAHAFEPAHWAAPVILTATLVAWAFAVGWRPFTPAHKRLRTCPACGTLWRPADEGTARCPACGA